MEKAIVRIGFNYGYLQNEYLEKHPEQTGFKVLTENGLVFETKENKIEDTDKTINLYADDIVTEEYLNNGYYLPVRLKVTDDNVPHFLLPERDEKSVKNTLDIDTENFDTVVRFQHLTRFAVQAKDNSFVNLEIENDDGSFTKLTGNSVLGYLDGKAVSLIETENNIFKDNENTILLHEYVDRDNFGGDFYDDNGREIRTEIKDNKIYTEIIPERDFENEYYDF